MMAIDFTSAEPEWLTAWNAHDLERILAHYSEDAELISPFVAKLTGRSEGVLRGKAALRDYFARGLTSSGFTPVCGVAFWNTAASTACARRRWWNFTNTARCVACWGIILNKPLEQL